MDATEGVNGNSKSEALFISSLAIRFSKRQMSAIISNFQETLMLDSLYVIEACLAQRWLCKPGQKHQGRTIRHQQGIDTLPTKKFNETSTKMVRLEGSFEFRE